MNEVLEEHYPREVYLRGGPLDGQVLYAESPTVRYAWLLKDDHSTYVEGSYVSAGRYVAIRWDLPDDGSLKLPDVFTTGMGRLVFDVRVFDWAEEGSPKP